MEKVKKPRNIKPHKLLEMFYPANYADEDECKHYLRYKYGITIDPTTDPDLSSENLLIDLYKRSLKLIKNYIDEPIMDSYVQWDILYLLIKEYLYLYCTSLKTKRTAENPYSESKLATIFTPIQNDKEQYAKTLEKYYLELESEEFFHRFKEEEFFALFESKPYSIIAYNLIGLSHENSWLLYSIKNWPALKHKELADKLSQYIRYRKPFCDDNLIHILKLELSLDTLKELFEEVLTTLKNAYATSKKNYDWSSYSKEQQNLALNLLISSFSKIYDETISKTVSTEKYLWSKLAGEKIEPYRIEITKLFLSYLEIMNNNHKSTKGFSISAIQWVDYVVALQEAYKKIKPSFRKPSNIEKCRYASALWINELLFPTLSIMEFIYSSTVEKSLSTAININDTTHLGYLCFNLLHCPNTFIRDELLNNFNHCEYTEEWDTRLSETVDWFSKVYYPLLETVFHLQFKNYFPDLDSLEQFLSKLPFSFFDDFFQKYNQLFKLIEDLGKNRTKKRKKVNTLGSKKSIIVETFLNEYLQTYGVYKEIENVKINTPVTMTQLLF